MTYQVRALPYPPLYLRAFAVLAVRTHSYLYSTESSPVFVLNCNITMAGQENEKPAVKEEVSDTNKTPTNNHGGAGTAQNNAVNRRGGGGPNNAGRGFRGGRGGVNRVR